MVGAPHAQRNKKKKKRVEEGEKKGEMFTCAKESDAPTAEGRGKATILGNKEGGGKKVKVAGLTFER